MPNQETENRANIDLESMQDLNQRLVEAMAKKDLDGAMDCFWNDPDLVVVLSGILLRGPDQLRVAFKGMFDQNKSIELETNEVSYVPSGDGVLAVGTATYTFNPIDGPPRLMVERWSDLRRKIDGQWVMVLDHTTEVAD